MTLVSVSKNALRTVKRHTVGYTHIQGKVIKATENWPLDGSPFVSLQQRFELADLSWDDDAFEQITEILMQRLLDRRKWRRVVKALMVLHYCLQRGSGRFSVWCQLNMDLLRGLEFFEYTFEEDKDRGIEVRREVRRVMALLEDPQYMEMRTHAEGQRVIRGKSLSRAKTMQKQSSLRSSLRRRGAIFGWKTGNRSDISSAWTQDTETSFNDSVAPVTIRQKVHSAVGDDNDLDVALEEIKEIARGTTCPDDFMEIMEAIMEGIMSHDQNKTWGQVLRAILLLRQCLANVSDEVANHFQGNPKVTELLRGFSGLGAAELLGGTVEAIRASLPTSARQSYPNEKSVPITEYALAVVPQNTQPLADAPIPLQPSFDPPMYSVNPDTESQISTNRWIPFDTKQPRRLSPSQGNGRLIRPLPTPPAVDWSRLHRNAVEDSPAPASGASPKELAERAFRSSPAIVVSGTFRPLPMPPLFETGHSLEDIPPTYAYSVGQPPRFVESPAPEYQSEDDIEYDECPLLTTPELSLDSGRQDSDAQSNWRARTPDTEQRELLEEVLGRVRPYEEMEAASALPLPLWPAEGSSPARSLDVAYPPTDIISPFPPSRSQPLLPSSIFIPQVHSGPTVDPSPPSPSPPVSRTTTPFDEIVRSHSPPGRFPPRCLTGLLERPSSPPIARGGYSDVWKSRLEGSDGSDEGRQSIAMKILRAARMRSCQPGVSPIDRLQKRVQREVDIWCRLEHPNIVPFLGYAEEEDGTPILVSPWFDHGDVLTYLRKHPFADRRKLVREVAEGLIYLHGQKPPIVHGDLKSGNVLINKKGDAALCDFGLSKLLQDCPTVSTTSSSTAVGTLRWCAPELLTAEEPRQTLESDVWAFAALSLEILTGRLPFCNSTNDAKVLHNIVTGIIPARVNYPELPADNRFWDVLERCWKMNPEERPSMADLRDLIFDDEMFTAL